MNMIIKISLILIVLVLLLSFSLLYLNTHPPRYPYEVDPSRYAPDFEAVTIPSGDGTLLDAWLFPEKES